MAFKKTRTAVIVCCVVIVILTFSVFSVILENDFVSYDDPLYITKNSNVLNGITPETLGWAFRTTETGNWEPLTWISHMTDVQLFGLDPGKHHLVSLLIHCVNALLVFWLFYKMTDSLWASFLTALLFAIHPLRVESVAWASERKDVLSAFFGLLSLLAYTSFTRRKSVFFYCLTGVFLALGLMAKSMLVTWPFVFLLLDFWPLKRLSGVESSTSGQDVFSLKQFRLMIIEKIPFFCLAFIFCLVVLLAQTNVGAVFTADRYPLYLRVENAINSYVSYIKLTLMPFGLGALYPLGSRNVTVTNLVLCLLVLAIVTFYSFRLRNQKPWLLMGWLWFSGTLVPVLGLIQIGRQAMADRYTYLPSIGLSVIAAFFVVTIAKKNQFFKVTVPVVMSLVIITLMGLTVIQCSYWNNSLILFQHTIKVTNRNYAMHMNYGNALANAREFEEALEQYQYAHEIVPENAEPLEKTARVYMARGQFEQAVSLFKEALSKNKADVIMDLRRLGQCYTGLGQLDDAVGAYQTVLKEDSKNVSAMISIANLYEQKEDFEKSLDYYNQALSIDPESVLAMNNLAMFYANKTSPFFDLNRALEYSQKACKTTSLRDKESLIILLQILEQDPNLQNSLSKEFLTEVNSRVLELESTNNGL